jgi:hypothetical protein
MPAIWAALTAAFGFLIRSRIAQWIATALAAFGLHLFAQKFAVTPALNGIKSAMGGLGADGIAWMAFLKVDKAISIVLTAYAAAAALSSIKLRKSS